MKIKTIAGRRLCQLTLGAVAAWATWTAGTMPACAQVPYGARQNHCQCNSPWSASPCFGVYSTCWRAWPGECESCPSFAALPLHQQQPSVPTPAPYMAPQPRPQPEVEPAPAPAPDDQAARVQNAVLSSARKYRPPTVSRFNPQGRAQQYK
ncbi:hypothetical protein NA78x_001253 [Anatilimnocola sp. NA78]|uniref:hypothetical protein n=1 Tax=Anatilimnocola sp. NA78 TaxID=3415683 RepID=UPI003CE58C26